MMRFISLNLALVLLLTSLTSLSNVAQAAPNQSTCENGECIPKLIDRLEELGRLYKAQCLPKNIKHTDIENYHLNNSLSESCWKIMSEINHLEEQLQTHQGRLEARLGCEGKGCNLPGVDKSLNAQLTNISKIEANLCTEPKKQKIRNQCGSDLNCVLVGSALGLGGPIADLLVPSKVKPPGCSFTNDNCTIQLATGFLKSVVTLFKGAWDLLKMLGRGAGKKMTQFWNWVKGAENHTATSQLALAKASKDPSIFNEIIHDFPNAMKKIWHAFVASMKEWMKTKVFCQKWSGVAQFSTCLEPTNSIDCIPCKTYITGLCSISGTILSEVVPAFLSGGLTIALKQSVNGAAKIARLYRVTKKGLDLVKGSRVGKLAISAAGKTDEILKVSSGIRLSSTIVTGALSAIRRYMLSPARKAIKISLASMSKAAQKGKVYLAVTPTGKALVFSGKVIQKTGQVILYPIDNHLTTFAYQAGARSMEKAFRLGKPILGAQTALTKAMIVDNKNVESILVRIEEEKILPIVNQQEVLKLESELLHNMKPVRINVTRKVIHDPNINLNDLIKNTYPELQYGDLARILPSSDVLRAEKELYAEILNLSDGPRKEILMSQFKQQVSRGEARNLVVGNYKTPYELKNPPTNPEVLELPDRGPIEPPMNFSGATKKLMTPTFKTAEKSERENEKTEEKK